MAETNVFRKPFFEIFFFFFFFFVGGSEQVGTPFFKAMYGMLA